MQRPRKNHSRRNAVVGQPYPAGPPCATGKAKVNQAYVWGLTRTGSQVWFGTGANTFCLTSGADLAFTTPLVNDDFVCEYGESQIVKNNPAMKRLPALVVPVQSYRNGQVYYRLQMGTTSQAHSTVLCQRMRMIGQSCVVIDERRA